ncbi:MAG: hypothetical protein IIC90_09560 [Chloroflexi bacterium]|nr:hypothetical protein [Chloroflexota bacterium]
MEGVGDGGELLARGHRRIRPYLYLQVAGRFLEDGRGERRDGAQQYAEQPVGNGHRCLRLVPLLAAGSEGVPDAEADRVVAVGNRIAGAGVGQLALEVDQVDRGGRGRSGGLEQACHRVEHGPSN